MFGISVMRKLLILLYIPMMACATIVTQDRLQVELTSAEHGTRFYVDGKRKNDSVFTVNQRKDHVFTGKKKGCLATERDFEKGVSGWFVFGNLLLFGGPIGMLVDVATENYEVGKETVYDVTPKCNEL